MQIDLHSHSTYSDGNLTPQTLIQRALESGVAILSITDHDSVDAYEALGNRSALGLTLVPGVEISTYWERIGVHVVGLNFALDAGPMRDMLGNLQTARQERAEKIGERIRQLGFDDPMPRVSEMTVGGQIGRPHFARFLVEIGQVKSTAEAFKKFLGQGKRCDVRIRRANLAEAVEGIRASGGVAVLAHPAKYGLTRAKLARMVDDFKHVGGEALEVVSGNQTPDVTQQLAALCHEKALLASCGSDFHGDGQAWAALGRFPALPAICTPVWDRW